MKMLHLNISLLVQDNRTAQRIQKRLFDALPNEFSTPADNDCEITHASFVISSDLPDACRQTEPDAEAVLAAAD